MKEKRQLTPEEEMLASYRAKVKREAVIKSVALALMCGFLLAVILSAISFATLYNTLYIALGVFAAVTTGLSFLFYFVFFRPSLKVTAERVDGIGLEERVLTMVELSGQEGVLAEKQREDTQEVLSTVSVKQMRSGIPKFLLIILAVIAALSIFMMSYSTVLAVQAEETREEQGDEELAEDDRIIKEMIEKLRELIDSSPVSEELKGYLHGLVDNLERSLKPTDPLDVKIAKVSETAQEIHKLIEEYLSRTTVGQELQKHDTTKSLGDAIVSGDISKVEQAFRDMYDSIEPHVMKGEYDILAQTADDIDQSIEDASIHDNDALEQALKELADALRRAIPKEPPHEGEEEHVGEEVMKDVQDAMDQAMEHIKDAFEQQDQMEDLDEQLQDAIQDALDKLGDMKDEEEGGEKLPEEEEPEEDPDKNKEEGGEQGSTPPPTGDGDIPYDSVIDGKTPYDEVYDKYEEKLKELLESGDLTEEERKLIEDYFKNLG